MTTETTYACTYSPDDNKLRLNASARLDAETYARVKVAGFAWAPKQGQFVAPMWTPERADLALDLAGEISDEDSTLMDRAEGRAERFSDYEAKRGTEAARAADHARTLAGGIPIGQPILIGHHSEARARRDAERIERGMRKAVDLFDTAEYWRHRAAGAIRHAKYKEDSAVRHRRIKGIEADQRKQEKTIAEHESAARIWAKIPRYEWDKQTALALFLAGRSSIGSWGVYSELQGGRMHGDTAWRLSVASCEAIIQRARRWLDHYDNRLSYERAMLGEAGGIAADRFDIQPGGRVLIGSEWCVVLRVNKSGGRVVSVRTTARYSAVRGIKEVTDYREPEGDDAAKVAAVVKAAPLCNYRTEGCVEMTAAEWKMTTQRSDSYYVEKVKATPEAQAHRRRSACKAGGGWMRVPVFLTDAKVTQPPAPNAMPSSSARGPWNTEPRPAAEPVTFARKTEPSTLPPVPTDTAPLPTDTRAEFEAMRVSLRAGVQVVSAPQLFPTPAHLAARMVELADITHGARVLEPSAGTGRLIQALRDNGPGYTITAVELDFRMVDHLRVSMSVDDTRQGDFLALTPADLGCPFDRILMNPPFALGADVEHVTHAVQFLKPGGRLVAIMSAGVLFRSDRKTGHFRQLVERMGGIMEELPADTFATSGTGVNTVLVVLDAPQADEKAVSSSAQASLV